MQQFVRYAVKRLLFMPFAVLIIVTITFGLVNAVPSDPARHILGDFANQEQVDRLNAELGLDRPLHERYVTYLTDLAKGDLGRSYYTQGPVTTELRQYFPDSIELIVPAIVVATVFGMLLGGLGALFAGRALEGGVRFVVTVLQSLPDFFLGLLLIYFLYFRLRLSPAPVGRYGFLDRPPESITGFLFVDSALAGDWGMLRTALTHTILPAVTLGLYFSSYFAKTMHARMSEALDSEQVEYARAMGLSERQVLGYAFRVARTSLITYGGILLAALIGGAAIVETVFSWNGAGQWAIRSIINLDVPAVQGFVLVVGLATLVIFFLLDLLVAALDPRISYYDR